MPRTCIFCGETPVTREHVWPRWAQTTLPKGTRIPIARVVDIDGQERVEDSRFDNPFTDTARVVCGHCNHGWMAELENDMKELFTAMAGEKPVILDEPMQRVLARWALKTAIILDHAQARPWQPTTMPDELRHLAELGEPSPNVLVWLASCYDPPSAQARLWGTSATVTRMTGDRVDAAVYGGTLSLQSVCFQVLYSTFPEMPEAFMIEERPAITLIWPFREAFDWSSRNQFANRDLLGFAEVLPTTLRSTIAVLAGSRA